MELTLPLNCIELNQDEMMYLDGGALTQDSIHKSWMPFLSGVYYIK